MGSRVLAMAQGFEYHPTIAPFLERRADAQCVGPDQCSHSEDDQNWKMALQEVS